jgi:hypothetical protein
VREAGVIASQAVLIAIGIDWDGRRQVLAVELANRGSRSCSRKKWLQRTPSIVAVPTLAPEVMPEATAPAGSSLNKSASG